MVAAAAGGPALARAVRQSAEDHALEPGDRLFVPCQGGPCRSRVETFPPRLEIDEPGGPTP